MSSGKEFRDRSVPMSLFHPSAISGAFKSVASSGVKPRAPRRSRTRSAIASSPGGGNLYGTRGIASKLRVEIKSQGQAVVVGKGQGLESAETGHSMFQTRFPIWEPRELCTCCFRRISASTYQKRTLKRCNPLHSLLSSWMWALRPQKKSSMVRSIISFARSFIFSTK